ncbi:hypothetical protein B4U84_29500 [Westiellopsis prolifica IICB1]|nr:hypothetical protein B4U84_29500 [Westiellopsis prolifica IICB1]
MAETTLKISYKELALGSFTVGLVSLGLAIPGYLKDWREYRICEDYFGITTCQNRAYTIENPEQPRVEPTKIYFNEALTKILGITIACAAFPLAGYAAREMASISEYNETVEAINKTAQLQSLTQEQTIDLKLGGEAYEAMKAIEMADVIDRFRETLYIPVSAEDVDAEIEAIQQQLKQAENRKALEFEIDATAQPDKPQISENAQKLFDYLFRKEASKDKPMSVNTVNKNGVIKDADAAMIRELFAELVLAELAGLDDDGNIYLMGSN